MIFLITLHDSNRIEGENLGVEYLSAAMEKYNIAYTIVDQSINSITNKEILFLVNGDDLCAFSIDENNYKNTIEFVRTLKSHYPAIKTACGGTFSTVNFQAIDKLNIFDMVVRGGNEKEIVDHLHRLYQGEKYSTRVIDCHGFIKTLSPHRDYYVNFLRKQGFARVLLSRGCSFGCSFCMINIISPKWEHYTKKSIIDDIKNLQSHGINSYIFTDDSFLGNKFDSSSVQKRLDFIESVLSNFNNIYFRASIRPEHIKLDTLIRLKKMGMIAINIGIESIAIEQKKRYNKHTKLKQIYSMMDILKELNINTTIYMIPFDPLVSISELKENFLFMNKYASSKIKFSSPIQTFALYENTGYFQHYLPFINEYTQSNVLTGKVSYAFNDKNVTDFYFELVDIPSKNHICEGLKILEIGCRN